MILKRIRLFNLFSFYLVLGVNLIPIYRFRRFYRVDPLDCYDTSEHFRDYLSQKQITMTLENCIYIDADRLNICNFRTYLFG